MPRPRGVSTWRTWQDGEDITGTPLVYGPFEGRVGTAKQPLLPLGHTGRQPPGMGGDNPAPATVTSDRPSLCVTGRGPRHDMTAQRQGVKAV